MSWSLRVGLFFVCLWFGLPMILSAAEGKGSQKGTTAASGKSSEFSTDNLKEQIKNLDTKIQKLREQSLALQEETRRKLQAQLDILKQQQDALIPRIETLRDTSEQTWQEIKDNIQKAIEDLKSSVDTMSK